MATTPRGRPYEMPDPDDRSVNKPHDTVERQALLGLYNQAHPDAPAQRVSDAVRQWFEPQALAAGWAEVIFIEGAAILKANIQRV